MSTFPLIALALASMAQDQARMPAAYPGPPSFLAPESAAAASRTPKLALSMMGPVRRELRLTAAQGGRLDAIARKHAGPMAADAALMAEADAALLAALKPKQWARLDQVQLRVQGPAAFDGPDLPRRLGLLDDQVRQARALLVDGREAIGKAALALLPLQPGDRPESVAAVRKLVRSPEFLAAKGTARRAIADAREATIRRIEQQVLKPRQATAYRKLLGEPFDVESIWPKPDEDGEIASVAAALGLNLGGQRADPDFDPKVARPAYPDPGKHPSVLFDEAHHNFHTAGGRYKAFADLVASDGYRVTPNRRAFSEETLAGHDLLVVANALGAEGQAHPDAAKPAFTDAESDAVRDWVDAGGSLLLITDRPPFGAPSEELGRRFGVEMSRGMTFDPTNSERDRPATLIFSRSNGLLPGDHPIVRGRDESERVDRVLTFAGQSLRGPEGSVAFLKLAATAIDRDPAEGLLTPAAGRSQGLAFAHGKGRVVVLGEAGQLSAQVLGFPPEPMGMNYPGSDNRRLALNLMHWLSRLAD